MGQKIEFSDEEKAFIISLFNNDKFSDLSNAKKEKCFMDKFSKKISFRSIKRFYDQLGICISPLSYFNLF